MCGCVSRSTGELMDRPERRAAFAPSLVLLIVAGCGSHAGSLFDQVPPDGGVAGASASGGTNVIGASGNGGTGGVSSGGSASGGVSTGGVSTGGSGTGGTPDC